MVVSTPELTVTLSATSAVVSNSNVTALSAMVSNTGDGVSPATTLRWYRSADPSLETNADHFIRNRYRQKPRDQYQSADLYF